MHLSDVASLLVRILGFWLVVAFAQELAVFAVGTLGMMGSEAFRVTVREHPSLWISPLLTYGALVGLGFVLVLRGERVADRFVVRMPPARVGLRSLEEILVAVLGLYFLATGAVQLASALSSEAVSFAANHPTADESVLNGFLRALVDSLPEGLLITAIIKGVIGFALMRCSRRIVTWRRSASRSLLHRAPSP